MNLLDTLHPGVWLFLILVAVLLGPLYAFKSRLGLSLGPPPPLLPPDWRQQLDALPPATLLDAAQRQRWEADVERFVQRVRFIGCNGFTVTGRVRLIIAGYASLLLLKRPADAPPYPRLKSVLVYPEAFLVPQSEPDEYGLVHDEPVEQIGESWEAERVILSWTDVEAALAGSEVNVVVHEFAHQLDDESADASGAPPWRDAGRWAEVMSTEFARLRRHRRPPVLDPYGAESPEEFFGVVMEAYFQRGAALQRHHPALYDLLRDSFGLDTSTLPEPDAPEPVPGETTDD